MSVVEPTTANRAGVTARFGRLPYRVQLWLLLLPLLTLVGLVTAVPALLGLPVALTDSSALDPGRFLGLANVVELLRDPIFWRSVFNSAFFVGVAAPLRLLGALALALLLVRPFRGSGVLRAGFYLPTVVPDVAWSLLWLWLLNPAFGPVNLLLGRFGIAGPAWMVEPWGARFGIVLLLLWQLGEGFVVCLAGLADIPRQTLEQSAVDGGGVWQTFRFVTLPLLAPLLLILLLRDTIVVLQATFVPALIMSGGGPNYATTSLPLYVYRNAFEFLRYGYATAMTWALFLLTALAIWGQFRLASRIGVRLRDAS